MAGVPDARYTHGHHDSVLRSHRWRTAENSAAYLLSELRPGLDLLDVGCGPATITFDLAARVAPGRTIGIDASEDVIRQARESAGVRDEGPAVELRVGDAYTLDLADDSVDVVHAHQVLQHLRRPVDALWEWQRVVRPGGVVAARDADYAAMTWHPEEPRLDRWLELYEAISRRNGGEPDAGRRLLAWAHEAGFNDVTPSASAWCFATPEDRSWWAGTWAERITRSAIATQLVADGLATAAELEDLAAGWRAWADERDGWFLIPHGEVLCRVDG
jgi:ubiquinone/menaquinone biosynthesis C-methylase UbiE